MSSEVDICNLALSHLGDEAGVVAIAPPDGTQQAAFCGTYYPLARNALLEMHPWNFATKRVALAAVTNPSPDDWQYAYAIPSTCIRPLSALSPGVSPRPFGTDTDDGSFPYLVEAGADGNPVLYTNVATAVLRYIDLITDTARYTPGFTTCLARLLSSYLAGPIIKGPTGIKVAQAEWQAFQLEYGRATALNANVGKRNTYETRKPEFIRARGLPQRWPNSDGWNAP